MDSRGPSRHPSLMTPNAPRSASEANRAVEILAYPAVRFLDVTGPRQAFASANDCAATAGNDQPYEIRIVSPGGRSVDSSSGLRGRLDRVERKSFHWSSPFDRSSPKALRASRASRASRMAALAELPEPNSPERLLSAPTRRSESRRRRRRIDLQGEALPIRRRSRGDPAGWARGRGLPALCLRCIGASPRENARSLRCPSISSPFAGSRISRGSA